MTYTYCIKNMLGIKDKNIILDQNPIYYEKKKGISNIVMEGSLTYQPKGCPNCGIVNESPADIIKYGTKTSTIKLTHINFQPLILKLRKQKFYCKHCHSYFLARTKLVNRHCFISNIIKSTIAMELRETQAMSLIAKHFSVSSHTVIRILKDVGTTLKTNHIYLPQHISIDEFKSVKDVSGAMSFLFIDATNHRLMDVVENRQLSYLEDYFLRYPLETRQNVRTVTMDMYSPYIELVKGCFPHAQIVIDRFHIVQHLNRALNSIRIQTMNDLRYSRPRDYRKLKRQWKLILKNEDTLNYIDYSAHRLYDGLVSESMMVNYLIGLSPRLSQTYILINRLKNALKNHDFEAFHSQLEESKKYQLPKKVRTAIQTMEKHADGIENACLYTLSNGAIEGLNNKIKTIKRTGYGYRNFENLRARILISFRLTISDFQQRPLRFKDEIITK